jgi:hypothetical protein
MHRFAMTFLAAATMLAARGAAAQADTSRALTPLSMENNSAVGYASTRESHLVQHDAASVLLARRIEQDLVSLRIAEDVYYANHLAYATSLSQLVKFRQMSDAVITLHDVSDRGWVADATHPSLPKSTFTIRVTRAPAGQ